MKIYKFLIAIILFMLVIAYNSGSQFVGVIVSLTGKVLDETTKEPVSMTIKVYDDEGKIINRANSNSSDGYYFLTSLNPAKTYKIHFDKLGYLNKEVEFSIPETDKYLEYSKDFLVNKKEVGYKIPLKVPPFDRNKDNLRRGAEYFLKNQLQMLKTNEGIKFKIHSYPENNDNPDKNLQMTNNRAEELKQWLIDNGIDKNRLESTGHKNTDPANPPPSERQSKGKRYKGSVYFEILEVK